MGRQSTFPTLYDECKTVSITKLMKWGYLAEGQQVAGTLSWSRFGEVHSRIGITVFNSPNNRIAVLDYLHNQTPKKYQIRLVSVRSNIGNGRVWYFVCPVTQKRCRKLYLCRGYFYHRDAFTGCFYEKQTYSRAKRDLCKHYENYFGVEHAYEKIYSKHFKKHYDGSQTKKYTRLLQMIQKGDEINEQNLYSDYL